MSPRRPLAALLGASLLTSACATTHYTPQLVARGELTLRYDGGYEMWAGGRRVTRSLLYKGLDNYVRCLPVARNHARQAARDGRAAVALSVLGATLGVAGLGGLYGLADEPHMWYWLGSGIGVAALGTVFSGLGRMMRNSANGRAVDAMNFYNDAVGSLGASCDDLRYPAPAGPRPDAPAQLPPPPMVGTPAPSSPPADAGEEEGRQED